MTRRKVVLGKTSENGVSSARNRVTGGNFVRPTLQSIDGNEVTYFKPHDGENCIRILPPTEDQNFWATQIFIHYSVGVDDAGFMCRKKMQIGDGRCPICEERAVVSSEQEPTNKEEEEALKELLRELKPKERWVLQIIDRDEEAKGVQVWNAPVTLVNEILKQTKIPARLGGGTKPIDDVKLGSDIMFDKGKGKGGFIEYTGVQVLDVDSEITESDIAEMFYLVDLFIEPTYEDVSKAFGVQAKQDDNESSVGDVDYGTSDGEEDVDEEAIKKTAADHEEQKPDVGSRIREGVQNSTENAVVEEKPVSNVRRRRRSV